MLINGTKADSLDLKEVIDQIKPLISNHVSFIDDKREANFIIEFPKSSKGWEFQNTEGEFIDRYLGDNILKQHFQLGLIDNLNAEKRSNILKYVAYIGLTSVNGKPETYYLTHFLDNHPSVFYPRIYGIVKNEAYPTFQTIDKFVITKLYDPNLKSELADYIIDEYGYWNYLNFKSRDLAWTVRSLIMMLLVILFFALLYKTLFIKNFKYPFLKFVLGGLFIGLCFGLIILVFDMLKIKQNFIFLYPIQPSSHDVYEIIPILSVCGVAITTLLYVAEKLIMRKSYSLILKAFVRLCICIVVGIVFSIGLLIIANDSRVFRALEQNLLPVAMFFFCIGLARSFFLYFKDRNEMILNEKDVQLSQLTASKAEAEVASLHARINPHFLYNSLNSIAGLAHSDADKTEKMAVSLSDLFRHNLNRNNAPFCTLEEEVEAVEAYLEIEQIRFGDRLKFKIEVDDTLKRYLIPRNIIQPLLENAIKHGTTELQDCGKIKLYITQTEEKLEISVYDNGPNFQEGIVSGYGLQSIFDILDLTYKQNATLSWENQPEKRIWISISKQFLSYA